MNLAPRISWSRGAVNPLQITSMIDVIFLLLIYFILTTTYAPPESQLAAALRADTGAAGRSGLSPQVIEVGVIDGAPGFRIGSRVLRDQRALTTVLRELPTEPGVVIKASGRTTARWAAAALQAARDAGFTKVTYVPTE